MALFGKKSLDTGVQRGSAVTPVDEVRKLRSQGLTNNQIVQTLQREGYKTFQIFDAMNQADMSTAAQIDEPEVSAEMPPYQQPAEPQMQPVAQPSQPDDNVDEKIEEIAEAIIDEKWKELLADVDKIIKWKNNVEQRMASIEKRFDDIKKSFDAMQAGVLGKMQDYDRNVTDISTEIKALEKVFQKVIPAFTENVNELSRITKGIKSKKS